MARLCSVVNDSISDCADAVAGRNASAAGTNGGVVIAKVLEMSGNEGYNAATGVYEDLVKLSKAIGAPLVATNDLHYTHEHDAKAHEALLASNERYSHFLTGRTATP